MRTTHALPVLLVMILGSSASADPDSSFAIVHVLGERPLGGRIQALGADGVVVKPSSEAARTFALDSVREIRFPDPVAPAGGTPPHRVTLVGGEVLVGRLESPGEQGFTLDVPGLGPVAVSFDVLRSLEVRDGRSDPCEDLADKHGPADAGDVAHLKGSGDKFTGTLVEADGERLVIESARGRQRKVEWGELLVLHLENDAPPTAEGVTVEVELAAGTRVFCAAPPVLQSGQIRFSLRSAPTTTLAAPLAQVRAVRFTGGRFDYASDLPFESTLEMYHPVPEGMAFGDLEGRKRFWGARKDRRPSGCPLRLAGSTYRHGFAMHSRSVVKIALAGRYTSFEAAVGIDDEVKRSGSAEADAALVDARVVADGVVVWEQKSITLADTPHKVGPVDLTGVTTLELVVDFGAGSGPVGDDVAWVNPILVKK